MTVMVYQVVSSMFVPRLLKRWKEKGGTKKSGTGIIGDQSGTKWPCWSSPCSTAMCSATIWHWASV
jgi:hypothetical protein